MATEITPSDFLARFDEFSSSSNGKIQMIIDDVVFLLSPYRGTTAYTKLQLYLCAHWLYLQREAAKGGENADASSANPVASKSVDKVSIGFSVGGAGGMTINEAMLNSTVYGQQFFMFWKQVRYRVAPYGIL